MLVREKWFICFLLLLSISVFAADKLTMLNAKEGLWETTVTINTSGTPGLPADALDKLTPEQRARMEEMMKQKGVALNGNKIVSKSCVTKDKIEKGMAFAENKNMQDNCTRTVVSSTGSHFEAKFHCDQSKDPSMKGTTDGTVIIDMTGSDSTKGSIHSVSNMNGHQLTSDSSFTSKYLGPDCGDVK